MNTNVHKLIHKKNAKKRPYIHKFYILAYILLNLQSIIQKDSDLKFLLTFRIKPHLNTQTSLHSLHTFKTNIYTHSGRSFRQYRPAFIRLYIQSYKRAFQTHIRKCISTCLQTHMNRTLQACNDSCVQTFLLNRHKT